MNAFYSGYLLLFGASALVCAAGAYRAREIPDPSVRRSLAALLLTCGSWAGAYVGAFLAPTVGLARAFHLLGLVVGAVAVGAWLWFCSAYAGRDLHRDPKALQVGFWVLAFVVVTKATNPWHELYFTTAPAEVPFSHFALDYHLLYWGSVGLAYALAAVGYFMLYDLFRNVGSGGGALGPLAGLMALPILLHAAGYTSPLFLNVSHEPLGVAAFAIGVFYLYGEEFEAVQFAGGQEEPAFVLGGQGTLQEYNRSAQELLLERTDDQAALGTPIGELLPEVGRALEEERPTIRFGEGPGVRYYQLERPRLKPSFDSGDSGPSHFLVLSDVTEHKMREEALEEESATLRQMSRVRADPEAPFEEKISRLIDLGREYLGLPYGFLTEISEGTQKITNASGPHPLLQAGATCPLSEAYCRKTIRGEGLLAIQNAPEAGWEEDPAYETLKLGSYIGAKVKAHGELYGTFCFAASEPRAQPFDAREKAFVDLLTRWTSYEVERRQAREQLERQNERLEQFSSVLTHDLRNPLNVAQGRLSLALEEAEAKGSEAQEKPTMLRDHLRAVRRAHSRMEQLIEDMLALTWGEQGLEAKDMEEVSLAEMAEGCWEQVEAPKATLQVEGDLIFEAHKGRLQRLLENLYRNAAEHGGPGVTVTVGALPKEEPPKGFYVEDDGPGIPEEKREKVFEQGYSSEEKGTGLGLSITEAIAEAHGWDASLTEGREGGARFEIRGTLAPGGEPNSR